MCDFLKVGCRVSSLSWFHGIHKNLVEIWKWLSYLLDTRISKLSFWHIDVQEKNLANCVRNSITRLTLIHPYKKCNFSISKIHMRSNERFGSMFSVFFLYLKMSIYTFRNQLSLISNMNSFRCLFCFNACENSSNENFSSKLTSFFLFIIPNSSRNASVLEKTFGYFYH